MKLSDVQIGQVYLAKWLKDWRRYRCTGTGVDINGFQFIWLRPSGWNGPDRMMFSTAKLKKVKK